MIRQVNSLTRDEMLHRFAARPIDNRYGYAHDEEMGNAAASPWAWGCCFATRNLRTRRMGRNWHPHG